MNFGGRTPKDEALRIIQRAFDRGASFFDTANLYNDGQSEQILGEALRGRREQATIATKVGLWRQHGKPEGLSPQTIRAALDESLQRLQTDYVDLYYLHAPDPLTPIEQTLDALQGAFEAKKIRAFGVSNFSAWRICELNALCDARKLPRPTHSQVLYNLLVRQLDLEYFAFARHHPLHTTVYNPLAGGLLGRASLPGDPIPKGSRFEKSKLYRQRYWSAALLELTAQYQAVAKDAGLSLVQLAYAWLLQRDGVDSVLSGPASVAQLDAALDAASLSLSKEVVARVDDLHAAFVGTDVSYAR